MPRSRLLAYGVRCGLIAPLLWLSMIVICGGLRPGFDHFSQYISELGERGSSTELLMRYGGFVASGLLHIGFAAALFTIVRESGTSSRFQRFGAAGAATLVGLNGIGRIGAGIFSCAPGCAAPLDPIQRLHGLFATTAFFAIIGAALLCGLLFRKQPKLVVLSRFSITSASAGMIFLVLMVASETGRAGTGLYERLASGTLSLWIFVTAATLWHGRRDDWAGPRGDTGAAP